MATIEEITDNNFQKNVLEETKVVVVDFWAQWCGPCRKLTPLLEQIQNEFGEVVKIYKDFEKEKKAIEQYLKLQMKDYEIAYVGDRKITWKKQERNTIDTTRLKKEHPEIVAKFMKTTTSRVLKII